METPKTNRLHLTGGTTILMFPEGVFPIKLTDKRLFVSTNLVQQKKKTSRIFYKPYLETRCTETHITLVYIFTRMKGI